LSRLHDYPRDIEPTAGVCLDASILSPPEQVRRIVGKPGIFVALVDDERRFDGLVDRHRLAEAVARRPTEPS
jgi:hypothetical protein